MWIPETIVRVLLATPWDELLNRNDFQKRFLFCWVIVAEEKKEKLLHVCDSTYQLLHTVRSIVIANALLFSIWAQRR